MPTHHNKTITVGLLITQGHWGGAQRYVFDLATSLAREMRVVVGVGSPRRGKELQERFAAWNTSHPEASVHVQQLTHLVREISPGKDLRALLEVRRFIMRNQLDILHCNSAKATVIGSIASVGQHIKRVITVHGFTFTEPMSVMRAFLYRNLERMAVRAADLTICPDRTSYAIARTTFHVPEQRLAHIPHTIQDPAFLSRKDARAALSRRMGTPITNETHLVGSIANFYPVKNHALLLQSFAILARTDRNARCVLIGEGQERSTLEQQCATMDCADRVHFLGAIEQAATLLPWFDVFALTSDKEGYPYVLLEARAAGIPIVSRAVGGCEDILEGTPNALCIHDATEQTIASALQTALTVSPTKPSHAVQQPMYEATRDNYKNLIAN